MYLIASLFLTLGALIYVALNKFALYRNKYSDLTNFTLTLIATFVGVFVAIDLTNRSTRSKERENVVELLNAASMELSNKIAQAQKLRTIYLSKDSSVFIANNGTNNNPVTEFRLYQSLVTNETMLRNMSPDGIIFFNLMVDNLTNQRDFLNRGSIKSGSRMGQKLTDYVDLLRHAQLYLVLETGYLTGITSKEDMPGVYMKAQKTEVREEYR